MALDGLGDISHLLLLCQLDPPSAWQHTWSLLADGPENRPYHLGPESHHCTHIVSFTYPAQGYNIWIKFRIKSPYKIGTSSLYESQSNLEENEKLLKDKSCNMCNFYVPFTSHWMLITSFWLWRKKISPLQSSEALWQQAETTGPLLLCTLYSLITTRLVSNENLLNARHHVLIEDAHCWNKWCRNSSAEHLAMSCSLCTKGKYSRSCWKAPLMH